MSSSPTRRAAGPTSRESGGRRPGRERLDGVVEVDEAYVGGVEEGGRGRYTETKAIVAVAVEIVAWSGYTDHELVDYDHLVFNLSGSSDPAHVLLPGPHRVISLVKRWLLGTYQGAVAVAQLPYYLDEFTFRFNRRGSRSRGLLFYRLLEQACQVPHTPTASLSQGTARGPSDRRR